MTMLEAAQALRKMLQEIYDPRESTNITEWVLEDITGINRIDRIMNHHRLLTEEQRDKFNDYAVRLANGMPVQYVTGYAWFMGVRFRVNEDVLIPRPETEELVQWTVDEMPLENTPLTILDVGTGSGCIPVMLKRKIPSATLHSIDISDKAIEIAKENASIYQADIHFHQGDFLNPGTWPDLPSADIIISNPPYIPISEKENLHQNVFRFEPHLALFVDNDDPLLFYRAIAMFGKEQLNKGGKIFMEISEDHGQEATDLLNSLGYHTVLKKDMQGKDRMVMLRSH
jgi:release factor glutamine methyltransferase